MLIIFDFICIKIIDIRQPLYGEYKSPSKFMCHPPVSNFAPLLGSLSVSHMNYEFHSENL